ncbi:hypothetical protein M3637_03135 [Paenibacillus illinoisensis]|nr:hypothetical protein [Paenibacillus illinoisensis]
MLGLIPLAGFKYVKCRKALAMKTQEWLISIYLQANISVASLSHVVVLEESK